MIVKCDTTCYNQSMSRIFKTKVFARWAQKAEVSDEILCHAVAEIEAGNYAADLGGFVYKQRIPLPGRGKRGGARTIIAARINERYFFLRGFAKKEQDNISRQELTLYRAVGQALLALDDAMLKRLVDVNEVQEVTR